MTTIVAPPSNASKWQMGFNSVFKGLRTTLTINKTTQTDCGMSLGWWHSSIYGSAM